MSSKQSMLAQVIQITGATKTDILRVATQGGATARDWEIAEAIEAGGGRRADDMMCQPEHLWQAEHERLQNALWHQTRDEDIEFLRHHAAQAGIKDVELLLPAVIEETPEPTAPTNPAAVYDPEVVIYPEHTSPEESRELIEHHPHTDDTDELLVDGPDDEPGTAAWNELKHTAVWAEAARLTEQDPEMVTRTIARWKSAHQAIEGLSALLKARRPQRPRVSLAA
ncbi:hypothetical protein [Nocardiopsis ganjiahuensis]|uniref:hypothetical protein n=1 Tax=Nocardiopsis ganjiahuensis TaxID=239984 RepID=UPI00034C2F59|nr:hypothetical protein [Nocardiopsis ganjiahuensis]